MSSPRTGTSSPTAYPWRARRRLQATKSRRDAAELEGKEAIEAEGFTPHALTWQRGSLSPTHSLAGVAELRKLLREIKLDILHNISLKPVLLGGIASIGLSSIAVVNSLTGLGTLFVGNHRKSEPTRPLVAALRALLKRQGRHHRAEP